MTVDVAIIGGGPAGLATAAAVRRALPRATCHVFERARAMREIGASVGLGPNALNALNAIDPVLLKGFKSRGTFIERTDFYNLNATKLKFSQDDRGTMGTLRVNYGHQFTFVSWFDMQQSLFEQLPLGTVSVDTTFLGYEEDAQGVWVHFEGQKQPVHARLLVGADGAASAVRRSCLGAAACEPQPTGEILYRALLLLPTMWAERFGLGTKIYLGEPNDRCILLIPLSGNRMGVHAPAGQNAAKEALRAISSSIAKHTSSSTSAVAAPAGPLKLATQHTGQHLASSEERLARFLDIFQGAPDWLKEIVAAHPARLSENAELRRPATGVQWGKGRVTLVGDAAHLIPPMHAQGTSQAFEDVLQLGHSLAELGLNPDALRAYEAARTPRIMALQQYELDHPREPLDPQKVDYFYGMQFAPLAPEEGPVA